MDPEMTPEQKAQLMTWAGQRDGILLEISSLTTERDNLQITNKSLSASNTDLETRMNEIRGRIEELKIKEQELLPLISKDVAFLESTKTNLESQTMSLSKELELLTSQKTQLETDISFALSVLNVVKDEGLLLEKVIDRVVTASETNTNQINDLVANLAVSLEEIISVNRKNVFETNIVIDKLPKMLVEIQKKGLIRNKI